MIDKLPHKKTMTYAQSFQIELVILITFGIGLSYLCAYFELFENFYEYSRSHEDWELDEIIVVVPVLAVLLGLFSFNRVRQLRKEIVIRTKLENALFLDSTTNRLTGLPNETVFLSRVESALISAGALAHGCIVVIRTNVRAFTKGPDGEKDSIALMGEIVRRLQSAGPENKLLANMDNDTILLFLPKDLIESQRHLAEIAGLLNVPVRVRGGQIPLSVKIGATSLLAGKKAKSATLIRDTLQSSVYSALRALETILSDSRETIAFYDEATQKQDETYRKIVTEVESILRQGGFDCVYQPIVDLNTWETNSLEVLARWPQGHGEIIGPDVFVPIIEELGMVDQFTDQILDKALLAAGQWPLNIGLNLNISRLQLPDANLVQRLTRKLKAAGIAPGRLTVEITESKELGDIDVSRSSVLQMRYAGICVAVDDFGAGFANLNFLHDIEFDVIKIDRKIISDLTSNPKDQAILLGITAMTTALNTSLTAEGVETIETAEMLRKIGINRAQGFLFSKPMPQQDVAGWLARKITRPSERLSQFRSVS